MVFALISIALAALILLYLYSTKNFKYWQKRKIPCPNGALPVIGHTWDFVRMRYTFPHFCAKIYNDYRKHSMVGFYNFTTPTLMILEPKLVKTVMQTNFANFHENTLKIDPNSDPLLANNPFFTYGEKWIIGRKRLTYAFSSMRLKILLESVKSVCEKFECYVDKEIDKNGKLEVELKELLARFTGQVVAAAGFSVDGLCLDDEKERESFHTIGKSFLDPSSLGNFIFMFMSWMPFLNKIVKTSFMPKKADKFFRTIVADVIAQRNNDGMPRNDFIQSMLDLEKTTDDKFDLDVLASYGMAFFLDGYETSSSALSFICFNLAKYPDVQKRLRDEITSVLKKYNDAITYEALKEMTYMDQVINESQRCVPILPLLYKTCTADCELRGCDGLVCRVERGTPILIPVDCLQNDSRYWENAELFDPDRFGPERKHSHERFAYLPFGEGPRICVGMRMALLQIKACLVTLLKKYSLEVSPKTKLPLEMVSVSFLTAAKGGLWVYVRPL